MSRLAHIVSIASITLACGGSGIDLGTGETDGGTGDTGDDPFVSETILSYFDNDVDILFVIDDSKGTAQVQARFVAANLMDILEDPEVDANYRMAFTTTTVSNPQCDPQAAENGRFVASSCLGRLSDFSEAGSNPGFEDAENVACKDWCSLGPEALDERMLPTRTTVDADERVRPWMEYIDGASNLPPGVSAAEALSCFAPQGIHGCEFESPLAAVEGAITRMQTPGEPEYGFLRPHAHLLVAIVTNETDCSHRDESIFDPDGTRVFWSDPEAESPTSAVCWNAGVACTGGPGTYDRCDPADKDASGALTEDESAAVLYPVQRYVDLLRAIEIEKQEVDPDLRVWVSMIAGVPPGYASGMVDPVYADSADPVFQETYGIGPWCVDVEYGLYGIPPVRLRDFAWEFGERNLHSVCGDDYSDLVWPVAPPWTGEIDPACFDTCVADVDPKAEGLQVECWLEEKSPGEPARSVEPCAAGDGEWVLPDADTDVCYALRTDATQSGDFLDDLSDGCLDTGRNLEFVVRRRPGVDVLGGTSLVATCRASETPEIDCPNWE